MVSKKTRKIVAKRIISATAIVSLSIGMLLPGIGTIEAKAVEMNKSVVSENAQEGKRNVMYYGDWSIWGGQGNFYPKDIPADQLTHLNFAFLDFDGEGNLVFTDKDAAVGAPVGQPGVQWGAANAGVLSAFQDLRAQNPNLKIGVSLGGWSKSGDFSRVCDNSQKRAKLVENIIKFIEYTNMDFVDVDWEYPGSVRQPDLVDNKNDEGTPNATPKDKENYILLLQDLRNALDKKEKELGKEYELSVAIPAPKSTLDKGIDIKRLFEVVDFANIMTYDMRGAWDDTSGHQTGLYSNPKDPLASQGLSVNDSVKYLISQGAKEDKIVVGAAFYSRGWEKVSKGPDGKTPGLFGKAEQISKDADQSPSRGAVNEAPLKSGEGGRRGGVWSYRNLNEIKTKYPNIKEYWDDVAKAPYLYDETTGVFFTYENKKSIGEKTSYVNNNNLGGVISWMASEDAPTNNGTKRDELTKTIKNGLFGSEALPDHQIKYADLDVTATIKPYKESWGSSGGYEITIKNNETTNESGDVMRSVEKAAETIKFPKLYIKSDEKLTAGDYLAGTVTQENGYTVVDLEAVYDGKTIDQGRSYTFKLKSNVAPTDAKGIKNIGLSQRMTSKGAELGRQTIYGESVTPPETNSKPVLNGVVDKEIKVGDSFNPMEGVTAKDKEDGDLTKNVKVTGNVDTTKAGEYKLIYSVADSKNETTTAERKIIVKEDNTTVPKYDFSVGQGIEWPKQVNCPFIDMVAWVTKPGYTNNGAANLVKISNDSGVKYFNLGFIQSTNNTIKDGKVQWGWGGYSVLNEEHKDNTQYQGIKKSIKELRDLGGDVTISLGGLNGITFWEVTQDVDVLVNTYKEVIQGYGLTRLDLDIEGGAQDKAKNIANAKAIKKVQDELGTDIVLTLPVLPSGLTQTQLDVVEAYLTEGVDIKVVNIMTMCYGSGTLLPGENYGTGSVRAIDSTKNQLKNYYKRFAKVELTDEQAYGKIGATPSIGFEGSAHPIFTTEWSKLIVDHAIKNKIAMTSFWSMNRDAMLESNSGVKSQYEFTNIFKKFGSEDDGEVDPPTNTAPTITGVENKKIFVGETFDPMNGVKANDKEDGDLTSKVKVTGTVDTNTIGTYKLVYTVEDSEGLNAKKECIITVAEKPEIPEDTFDPKKIYVEGDTVIYKGEKYKAKWWTQGGVPENNMAWEKIVEKNPDGSVDYVPGGIYVEGDIVVYQGSKYRAKWWTNSVPGSDETWQLVG